MGLRIVAMSDTHFKHRSLTAPPGDILLHCGDLSSGHGSPKQLEDFLDWFNSQPHTHKVFILGNHDGYTESEVRTYITRFFPSLHFLLNSEITLDGLRIWGSPYTPSFSNWSWMLDRGAPIKRVWDQIPNGIDILMTHGPPYGHGDLVPAHYQNFPQAAGCLELLKRVIEVKPKIHFFGHIHEGYGLSISQECPTLFVNCASCDGSYDPVQVPIVLDLP
jgi:predicted phosphohydrolase